MLHQGVSVERWNGRAVRGALVRLEQTRYLERFTVEKAYKDPRLKKNILICIKKLREPEEADIRNLKFKRIASEPNAANSVEDVSLEDDPAGDDLMHDLDLNMTTDGGYDDEEDDPDTSGRCPPQWTPDRLLSNMVVDAVDLAGVDGIDTANLRDLTTGFFWKRPLESLVTRLTEDWYFNQPLYTRHLAIVSDTTMANDTKRVHYAYRTHRNFQKAVDAGEVTWEALQLEKGKKPKQAPPPATSVDAAGFSAINANEFHKRTGSSTLSEANGAITRKHRQTRDWESILLSGDADEQVALTPRRGPVQKSKTRRSSGIEVDGRKDNKLPRPLLTQAERLALGLPAKGRLGAEYESQIRAHRKKTGDPNSIPTTLVQGNQIEKPELRAKSKPKPKYERRPGPPLLTREERKARGLPEHGRLSFDVTRSILQEQGRNESLTHMKPFAGTANSEDGSEVASAVHSGDDRDQSHDQPESDTHAPTIEEQPRRREVVTAVDNSDSQASHLGPAKRTSVKRMMSERGARTETPNKRARMDLPETAEKDACNQLHPVTHANGPTYDEQGAAMTPNSADSAPDIVGPMEDSAASQPLESLKKQEALQRSKKSLLNAQQHVQASKTQYKEIAHPGLYIDKNATRSTNGKRGRPKKMFLANFRLPKLRSLSWFAPDAIGTTESADISTVLDEALTGRNSPIQNETIGSVAFPATSNLSETVSVQVLNKEFEQRSIDAGSAIETGIVGNDSRPEYLGTTTAHQMDTESGSRTPSSEQGSSRGPINEVSSTDISSSTGSRQLPSMNIAKPPDASLYRSPYGPPPIRLPLQTNTSTAASETSSVSKDLSNENPSKDVTMIASTDTSRNTASTQATKKKYDRSVRVGGGSVTHTRINIIKHVLDLCDGVIPGMDVIYNVFPAVWNELGPKKIACPIDGTIRDAIHAMCPSELLKATFVVPRVDVPGRKTKTIWYRSCFQFDSPEVQKVVHKIVQALPQKYCPPGLQKYWKEEEKTYPVLPKINNTYVAELYPPTLRKLDDRITQARRERRKAIKAAKEEERRLAKQAKKEAKRLAKEQKQQEKLNTTGSRQRSFKARQRLIGLNDATGSAQDKVIRREVFGSGDGNVASLIADKSLPNQRPRRDSSASTSSADEPLINMRLPPFKAIGHQAKTINVPEGVALASSAATSVDSAHHIKALMTPIVCLLPSTHTFSTDFTSRTTERRGKTKNVRHKRVRIEVQEDQAPRKRVRIVEASKQKQTAEEDDFLMRHHIEIRESSDEEEEEDRENDIGPTIAQRLAGLTGDQDQPDYEPPRRKKPSAWTIARDKRRRDRKRRSFNAVQSEKMKRVPETFDSPGEFRKLCYTLVIASSMVGDDGSVDWNIVSRVYGDAPRFNLAKTKRIWSWMQDKMNEQLEDMVNSFQSHFLKAYEEGNVEPIEDPETYDWAALVRWALSTCKNIELSLPVVREVLNDFQFDVLDYNILDRKVWYNTTLANVGRDERFAKYSFGSPLHRKVGQIVQDDDIEAKARSLIRVTISTPKDLYDKTVAHDRLKDVPEHLINRIVYDLLRASLIKERKVKRQVPGRNYFFASQFAKHYRRTFDLSDFMVAAGLKKELDAAFSSPDPSKRTYTVSRMAENGVVMTLLSLASDGKIRLTPRLPPIKNEFNAALPRISVWGFSEGDYRHRHMDRRRLFWPIEVVPTTAYQYGNPLRSTQCPADRTENDTPVAWQPLPEPPLPGGEGRTTPLLPIWSTIDGKNVVYPWWNRILNVVVQSLLFSPGITSRDILARCEPYTTELFEIQLVLDWLVTVKAAKKSSHGTYEVLHGYWAVFGDKLIDEEADEFGEHVRRQKKNMKFESSWRTEYNREYNLKTTGGNQNEILQNDAGQEVFNNARKQYAIAKHVATSTLSSVPMEEPADRTTSASTPIGTSASSTQDVEMTDVDAEGEDIDAEGESDDDIVRQLKSFSKGIIHL